VSRLLSGVQTPLAPPKQHPELKRVPRRHDADYAQRNGGEDHRGRTLPVRFQCRVTKLSGPASSDWRLTMNSGERSICFRIMSAQRDIIEPDRCGAVWERGPAEFTFGREGKEEERGFGSDGGVWLWRRRPCITRACVMRADKANGEAASCDGATCIRTRSRPSSRESGRLHLRDGQRQVRNQSRQDALRSEFGIQASNRLQGKRSFAKSGFEAVEAALEGTAMWRQVKGGVIAFGRRVVTGLLGALHDTNREHFRARFRGQLGEFGHFATFPIAENRTRKVL